MQTTTAAAVAVSSTLSTGSQVQLKGRQRPAPFITTPPPLPPTVSPMVSASFFFFFISFTVISYLRKQTILRTFAFVATAMVDASSHKPSLAAVVVASGLPSP